MQDYVVLDDKNPDVARRRRASLDVSTVRGARGMSDISSDYSESASTKVE